ncbi:MAG: hypothetical protein DRI95_03900, partial [Bacteroidetes bacterium]
IMKMLDKTSSGWAYWAYMKNDKWSPFDENDASHAARDIIVRPYPQCVAGQPVSYGYDPDENKFWLNFISDKDIKAPTEIYIPENNYPNGWNLNIDKEQKLWETKWDENRRILQLFTKNYENMEFKIIIGPKKE